MCGLIGYVSYKNFSVPDNLNNALELVRNRGRDAVGLAYFMNDMVAVRRNIGHEIPDHIQSDVMLCNMRAQPTSKSEWLKNPEPWMIQPYVKAVNSGFVGVIHNGTIANDDEFNKTFKMVHETGIVDFTVPIDSSVLLNFDSQNIIPALKNEIVGSYAIAMYDQPNGTVILAKNYMPLHVMLDYDNHRIFWASEVEPLLALKVKKYQLIDLPAYTSVMFQTGSFEKACKEVKEYISLLDEVEPKVLVVCSGGLDSTTVLTHYVRGYGCENVEVLHYHYGCKAEDAEKNAIIKIGDRLNVKVNFIDLTSLFKTFLGSPLTDDSIEITKGDEGIEYAKEWVPARNLILMSMAVGFAEKNGFNVVAIGANLTEQAAYPDNSLDFVQKLNDVVQYSVQNGVRVKIEAPFVNLMKQEIVLKAIQLQAPLDLMVSCYHPTGDVSCGTCGPCIMRKLAFAMNGLTDDYKVYKE